MEQWLKLAIWAAALYAALFVADFTLTKIQARKKAVKENERRTSDATVDGDANCE